MNHLEEVVEGNGGGGEHLSLDSSSINSERTVPRSQGPVRPCRRKPVPDNVAEQSTDHPNAVRLQMPQSEPAVRSTKSPVRPSAAVSFADPSPTVPSDTHEGLQPRAAHASPQQRAAKYSAAKQPTRMPETATKRPEAIGYDEARAARRNDPLPTRKTTGCSREERAEQLRYDPRQRQDIDYRTGSSPRWDVYAASQYHMPSFPQDECRHEGAAGQGSDKDAANEEGSHRPAAAAAAAAADQQPHQAAVQAPAPEEDRLDDFVLGSDDTSETSDSSGGTSAYERKRVVHQKIPPHILAVVVLAIPSLFLLIYSVLAFAASAQVIQFSRNNANLIQLAFKANNDVLTELGDTASFYELTMVNDTNFAYFRATMLSRRLNFDEVLKQLTIEAQSSGTAEVVSRYWPALAEVSAALHQARFAVDVPPVDRFASSEDIFGMYTDAVDKINALFPLLTANPSAATAMVDLMKLAHSSAVGNYLSLCRGLGSGLLNLLRPLSPRELEPITNARNIILRQLDQMGPLEAADSGTTYNDAFFGGNATVTAWAAMDYMLSHPATAYLNTTGKKFHRTATYAVDELHKFQEKYVVAIAAAEVASQAVLGEGFKLGVALAVTLFAAAFMIRSQMAATQRTLGMIAQSKTTARAIQSFVPKQMLRMVGCRTILEVTLGDSSDLAITMLYSTIRSFTTISESTTSAALFEWLQAYFKRMIGVTERHKGFVEKFVGDAIFAVFSSPKKAVLCGVAMQGEADKLNVDNNRNNDTKLVSVAIGIHHGLVTAGILGDEQRRTVALVSRDVAVASELAEQSVKRGAKIIMSEAVYRQAEFHDVAIRYSGQAALRAVDGSRVALYEVYQSDAMDLKDFKSEYKEDFERAVELMDAGLEGEAASAFAEIVQAARDMGVRDEAALTIAIS